MASGLAELYKEMKGLRRDVEEIKEMLIPEVPPNEAERTAVARGRKEYARGSVENWSEVKRRVTEH